MKAIVSTLLIMFSAYCYSQNSSPEIIKKHIPNNNGVDIYDFHNAKNITTANYNNAYNSRIKVYFDNKFYSADTLRKILNLDQYKVELIKIPKSITEDIETIFLIRKKENE